MAESVARRRKTAGMLAVFFLLSAFTACNGPMDRDALTLINAMNERLETRLTELKTAANVQEATEGVLRVKADFAFFYKEMAQLKRKYPDLMAKKREIQKRHPEVWQRFLNNFVALVAQGKKFEELGYKKNAKYHEALQSTASAVMFSERDYEGRR